MKTVLALLTLVLAGLVIEERARDIAGETQVALGEAAEQARDLGQTVSARTRERPWTGVVIAGGLGYVLGWITKRL